MDVELDFICDTCGRPVEDGQGSIQVRHSDITAYRAAEAEWHVRQGPAPYSVAQIVGFPAEVPWRIFHDTCNPDTSEDAYDIGVEHVRTWRALLGRTADLMGKTWLRTTDWRYVVGAAANGTTTRIAEHAENDAA